MASTNLRVGLARISQKIVFEETKDILGSPPRFIPDSTYATPRKKHIFFSQPPSSSLGGLAQRTIAAQLRGEPQLEQNRPPDALVPQLEQKAPPPPPPSPTGPPKTSSLAYFFKAVSGARG